MIANEWPVLPDPHSCFTLIIFNTNYILKEMRVKWISKLVFLSIINASPVYATKYFTKFFSKIDMIEMPYL
jgi:hypothetical protein